MPTNNNNFRVFDSMNILNYLYNQETDLDELLDTQGTQTVGSREPVGTKSEFFTNAMCFAKDTIEHQFDSFNTALQTVH